MAMSSMPSALGLIAGAGQFPFLVASAVRASGRRVAALGFIGHTDPALANSADIWTLVRLGRLNQLIRFFKSNRVTEICFAGAISKPKALSVRLDFRAMKLLLKVGTKGDDALLRALLGELESEGFRVAQAADFTPGLRGPAGVLTSRTPSLDEWEDLRYGWSVAKALGGLDVGQCVVVKRRMTAAIEALEGTDATITRGLQLAGPGCVVVKTVKPGQDDRIDLPSIGLRTVELLAEGKGACLGYEAGKTLFFDIQTAINLAERKGLCLIGLDPEKDPL
jgi:DUF1009 family protein